MNNKTRLTAEQVSKRLLCSVRQVGEYRKAGILPGTRFGKHWLYFEEDVENLISKNKGRDVCDYRNMDPENAKIIFGLRPDSSMQLVRQK